MSSLTSDLACLRAICLGSVHVLISCINHATQWAASSISILNFTAISRDNNPLRHDSTVKVEKRRQTSLTGRTITLITSAF